MPTPLIVTFCDFFENFFEKIRLKTGKYPLIVTFIFQFFCNNQEVGTVLSSKMERRMRSKNKNPDQKFYRINYGRFMVMDIYLKRIIKHQLEFKIKSKFWSKPELTVYQGMQFLTLILAINYKNKTKLARTLEALDMVCYVYIVKQDRNHTRYHKFLYFCNSRSYNSYCKTVTTVVEQLKMVPTKPAGC